MQLFAYMPQISYYIGGNGAIHPVLNVSSSEVVHLPANHTEVKNKWSSNSCDSDAFTLLPHLCTAYSYCLTQICLHEYVCWFISDKNF